MATGSRAAARREVQYPTSDGKPMAETDVHRRNMMNLIETLEDRFAADPQCYVSGNLLLYYVEGDKHKHVSPDVFVVRGVPKEPPRECYLLWEEVQGPDVVIELTSKSTSDEDEGDKLALYRDTLKVPEYFLFDPFEEYLKPPSMQGYRLRKGRYVPIKPVLGRLPSAVLGLHLERDGTALRLFDPVTGQRLLTPRERAAQSEEALRREEEARRREEEARRREEEARRREEEARRREEEARRREEEARRRAESAAADEQAARQRAESAAAEEQAARQRAESAAADEQAARQRAESVAADEQAARRRVEEELERLRRELEKVGGTGPAGA